MQQTNYMRIIPMTFEERVAMYMKMKKEELARMLAARDEISANNGDSEGYNYAASTWTPEY